MGDSWLGNAGWWIATLVVVLSCLKTVYVNPSHKLKVWLQSVAYYVKYWALWLWVWSLWHFWFEPQLFYLITLLLSLFYLYISWVEPNRLQVRYQHISLRSSTANTPSHSPLKVAVVGDIHVGLFSTKKQLSQLVHRLNQLEVDAVLVTGDWLYHAGSDIMGKMLVLKALNKPCYSVLSEADEDQLQQVNHRYQQSDGANYLLINEKITQVLQTMGITVLGQANSSATQLSQKFTDIRLLGFNMGSANMLPLSTPTSKTDNPQKTIILTHDIKQFLANSQHAQYLNEQTLVIAGQTHGGQMNVPLLTKWLVSALTGNSCADGLQQHQFGKTTFWGWTTTGIGMTGLPFRFHCPPRIDVLTID